MIEEPYRWVEAVANRREYVENQLAGGSPIAALSCEAGIVLFTIGREQNKIFEIYDRIAMGGLGHPGDIERLRMAAIEIASAEGFTRAAQDVSLRRLASYSLSPALKAAFEQIYSAPYLARLLFAELGRGREPDRFARIDYDGAIHSTGGTLSARGEDFGVLAGTAAATEAMEAYLREHHDSKSGLAATLKTAFQAWSLGHLIQLRSREEESIPGSAEVAAHGAAQRRAAAGEAALLERSARVAVTFRPIDHKELNELLGDQ